MRCAVCGDPRIGLSTDQRRAGHPPEIFVYHGQLQSLYDQTPRALSYKGVRERLAVYLLDRLIPGEKTVPVVHNNSQLAEYLNVSRPALSKEMNKLKREGVIVVEGECIRLSNLALLYNILNRINP